ncbi:hypothetical protein GA0116948_107106 [Chitinophaga costaii]|uniref:Uncharacterized protein n=1 Tax=Chitinophaga costaii TaxID=1335309 RepID=A0A1C4E5U2_9BACT|nr:hypothetical protein GA0116948_107106 [Chitinophaga costaii]
MYLQGGVHEESRGTCVFWMCINIFLAGKRLDAAKIMQWLRSVNLLGNIKAYNYL